MSEPLFWIQPDADFANRWTLCFNSNNPKTLLGPMPYEEAKAALLRAEENRKKPISEWAEALGIDLAKWRD